MVLKTKRSKLATLRLLLYYPPASSDLWQLAQSAWYLLTPCNRVLLEKLTGLQLVKKFPTFYGTWRFITAFTNARHLSQSWASSIQSISPQLTSWRSILILSSQLGLGVWSGLFPSDFRTKTLYTPLLSPITTPCPAHLILLNFITCTILGERYRSLSWSLCSFLHLVFTSPSSAPYSQTPSAYVPPKALVTIELYQVISTTNRMASRLKVKIGQVRRTEVNNDSMRTGKGSMHWTYTGGLNTSWNSAADSINQVSDGNTA